MNTLQRIVLILGAVALILIVWTAPQVAIFEGKYLTPKFAGPGFVSIIDFQTVMVRLLCTGGVIILLFFGAKKVGSL